MTESLINEFSLNWIQLASRETHSTGSRILLWERNRECFLTERFPLGVSSSWSGIPQVSFLLPILFIKHINRIEENLKSNILLFADDFILCRMIDTMDDKIILLQELNHLKNGSAEFLPQFHKKKCVYLPITSAKVLQTNEYAVNNVYWKIAKVEKDLFDWTENKL